MRLERNVEVRDCGSKLNSSDDVGGILLDLSNLRGRLSGGYGLLRLPWEHTKRSQFQSPKCYEIKATMFKGFANATQQNEMIGQI